MGSVIAEVIVALLGAVGLLSVCWLILGRMLIPAGGGARVYAVIPAAGSGEGLEHTVGGLVWLRVNGLADYTVVIADNGLDEEGLAAARALARKESDVALCAVSDLQEYIKEEAING